MYKGRCLVFIILLLGLCACVEMNDKEQVVRGKGGDFLAAREIVCENKMVQDLGVVKGSVAEDTYEIVERDDLIYHVYDFVIDKDYKENVEEEIISIYIPYAYVLFLEDGYVPDTDMAILNIEEAIDGAYYTILYMNDSQLFCDEDYVVVLGDSFADGYMISSLSSIYQMIDDQWIPWGNDMNAIDTEYSEWQQEMIEDEDIELYSFDRVDIIFPEPREADTDIIACL